MKREVKLVSYILNSIEAMSLDYNYFPIRQIANYTEDDVQYNFNLLVQNDYIDAAYIPRSAAYKVALTWKGHDFLDRMRIEEKRKTHI